MVGSIGKYFFTNKYFKLHSTIASNYLSTTAKQCAKKKFSIKNKFKFENELKNCAVTSSDLFPEGNECTDKFDNLNSSSRKFVSAELYPERKKSYQQNYNLSRKQKSNQSPLSYKGEILFGVHPVYLALLQKRRVFHHLYTREDISSLSDIDSSRKSEIIKLAETMNIPISILDSRGLRILATDAVHQGICLDSGFLPLSSWNENQAEIQPSENREIWLILDEILDPMNVGAIIRSAHFFGVKKLFVVKGNSCKLSPTVSKASSGTLEVMDIFQIENLEEFVKNRKDNGWCIVSTITYSECKPEFTAPCISATTFHTEKPIILILGNEGRGISQNILNLCDSLISIEPAESLPKGIDSLNVSVATGVLLYTLSSLNFKKL